MDTQLENMLFPMMEPDRMRKLSKFTHYSAQRLHVLTHRLIKKQSRKGLVPACYLYASICMSLLAIVEMLLTTIRSHDPLVGEGIRDQLKEYVSKW